MKSLVDMTVSVTSSLPTKRLTTDCLIVTNHRSPHEIARLHDRRRAERAVGTFAEGKKRKCRKRYPVVSNAQFLQIAIFASPVAHRVSRLRDIVGDASLDEKFLEKKE
jgi:hypothetical protein